MKHGSLLLIFLLVGLTGDLTGQVRVRMDLDSSVILIGDHLGLTINVAAPTGTTIKHINYGNWADAGNLEIIEQGDLNPVATEPELLWQQQLVFTTFDSGYHRLPPLEVIYELNGITDTANSSNLGLTVNTLPVQAEQEIMDNKDIIKEPLKWRDFLPYLIGLLAVIVLALIVWRIRTADRRKVAPPPPPPPPVPAHEIALEKLDRLAADAAWERGEIKTFQSEATYVLREYLENRFGLTALEATTPEIKRDLAARNLDEDGTLARVLATADLVKFAKATPPAEVHPRALADVRAFVLATQERPAPASTENSEEE